MMPLVFGFILVELFLVSWIDLRTKKISNKWPLVNLVIALILYLFLREHYAFHWEVLVLPLGFIVIGFFLFLVNIMGAGDSKYLASLFLLVPVELHFPFFEKILMVTITVGGILLTFRLIKHFAEVKAYLIGRHWEGLKSVIKSRFSYAPVIFLAWILVGWDLWK